MKYQVVVNGTAVVSDVSALKALNAVCNVMQGAHPSEPKRVIVYYRSGKDVQWKLENAFHVRAGQVPRGI